MNVDILRVFFLSEPQALLRPRTPKATPNPAETYRADGASGTGASKLGLSSRHQGSMDRLGSSTQVLDPHSLLHPIETAPSPLSSMSLGFLARISAAKLAGSSSWEAN